MFCLRKIVDLRIVKVEAIVKMLLHFYCGNLRIFYALCDYTLTPIYNR